MSIHSCIRSLNKLKNEHPLLSEPLNALVIKLMSRLERDDYQGLYEDEIQALYQHMKQNPSIPELNILLDELITVYSIDVARGYEDVQNTPSDTDDRFYLRQGLVRSYILTLHRLMLMRSLINEPYTFYYTIIHQLFPSSLERHDHQKKYATAYLDELEQRLNNVLKTIHERQLSDEERFMIEELQHISDYQSAQQGIPLDLLSSVQTYFKYAMDQIEPLAIKQSSPDFEIYKKYQSPLYKIKEIRQGRCPSMGNSRGMCNGITYSVANPETSPYNPLQKKASFYLTSAIEAYQEGQRAEIDDQKTIKRTRITRNVCGSDIKKQARDILDTASQHAEKDLCLRLQFKQSRHACYLSVKPSTHKIHYMDPNHGAYCFNNSEEFVEFYRVIYKTLRPTNYELNVLMYDPNNQEKPSNTFEGKLRSLLTGGKYPGSTAGLFLLLFVFVFYWTIAICLFTALPILLEASTAIILLAAFSGVLAATTLTMLAVSAGLWGLLCIPNYLYECWSSNDTSIPDDPLPMDIPVNTKGAALKMQENLASVPTHTEALAYRTRSDAVASAMSPHSMLSLFNQARQTSFCELNDPLLHSQASSCHFF